MKKTAFLTVAWAMMFLCCRSALALTGNITIEGRLNSATIESTSYFTAEAYYGSGTNLRGILISASFESVSGTTLSLSTTTNETVVVWAKGDIYNLTTTAATLSLAYNGVAKNTVQAVSPSTTTRLPFALKYTEKPGLATANVTVTTSGGTLADVKIMVLKIRQIR